MKNIKEKDARILVVDDEKQLADMLVSHLTRLGYNAKAVYSGRDVLSLLEQEDYNLIVLDLKMPDMDGMDVLDAVKQDYDKIVVIIITAFGTIELAVDAIKRGAYDFITKPFDLKTLDVTISRALEKHTLVKQLGIFRGLTLALIISIPLWLLLGIILASLLN